MSYDYDQKMNSSANQEFLVEDVLQNRSHEKKNEFNLLSEAEGSEVKLNQYLDVVIIKDFAEDDIKIKKSPNINYNLLTGLSAANKGTMRVPSGSILKSGRNSAVVAIEENKKKSVIFDSSAFKNVSDTSKDMSLDKILPAIDKKAEFTRSNIFESIKEVKENLAQTRPSNYKRSTLNPPILTRLIANSGLWDHMDSIKLENVNKEAVQKKNKSDDNSSILKAIQEKKRNSKKRMSEVNPFAMTSMIRQTKESTDQGKTSNLIKVIDISLSVVILINVVLALIDNELSISYSNDYLRNVTTNFTQVVLSNLEKLDNRLVESSEEGFRMVNMLISVFSAFLVYFLYKQKLRMYQINNRMSVHDSLWTSGLIKWMVIEMLIALIFYPPFLNEYASGEMLNLIFVYNINSIVTVLIMMKLYFVFRIFGYLSRWTNDTAVAVCRNHQIKPGLHFALKAEMRKRPGTVLSILLLISLIVLSFALRSFEFGVYELVKRKIISKSENDIINLADSLWLVIVTMTTVGFGDYFPKSHLGRFVGVLALILGLMILSLFVVSLGTMTEFTVEERKAFNKLKKLYADDNMENKATNVIKQLILLRYVLTNTGKNRDGLAKRFVFFVQLKKETSFFKNDYVIAHSMSMPVDEMLKSLETKLGTDIETLTKNLSKIRGADEDLACIAKDQEECHEIMKNNALCQSEIAEYMIEQNNKLYMDNVKTKFTIRKSGSGVRRISQNMRITKKTHSNKNSENDENANKTPIKKLQSKSIDMNGSKMDSKSSKNILRGADNKNHRSSHKQKTNKSKGNNLIDWPNNNHSFINPVENPACSVIINNAVENTEENENMIEFKFHDSSN